MFNITLKILFYFLFISMFSHISMALTGKEISNKVDQWLLDEGVKGKSVFSKNVIFKNCENSLKISKAFQGYKTVRVNCSDKKGLNILIRVKLQDQVMLFKSKKIFLKKINKLKKNTIKIKINKNFKVVKLNKTLEKKSVLKSEDLNLVSSDKSAQTSFFNSKSQLIGRKLKQNLKMGQLLHPRHLYEKFEIESGDALSIVSSIGNASVTVSGEAQNSGNLGDLIRVKNLRSGKIIKGYINKNKKIKVFR